MIRFSAFFSNRDKWIISGFYSLCLTLFLIPFPRSWSLYPLGAFLFFGLLAWIFNFGRLKDLFTQQWMIILAPVFYFLLHIIYFMFDSKWIYLEERLMFILIPVLGFPVFISEYTSDNMKLILRSAVFGILFICFFQFARAAWESISFTDGVFKFNPYVNDEVSRFHWDQLSTFQHPTYLTINVLWTICLIFFAGIHMKITGIARILLLILFSVFMFFLSSRAGIIVFALLLTYFIYDYLVTIRKRVFIILLIPFIFFGTYLISGMNKRMNHKLEEIIERQAIEEAGIKGLDPRTKSWFSALKLIKEKPLLGVGLNARNILAAEYDRQGYKTEAELKLNAHNQFLESQLTFGVAGTLILIWMLSIPVIVRKKSWYPSLTDTFLIIVIVSMFFESIFVRQWGIMFFLLFYCLLTMMNVESVIKAGSEQTR